MTKTATTPAGDGGAVAVEFALILPLLLLLLFGIIEFGFAFNTQISLTHAAREGVRVEALGTGDAEQAALDAFIATNLGSSPQPTLVDSCDDADDARLALVIEDYDFLFLPIDGISLRGEAVMRCGG